MLMLQLLVSVAVFGFTFATSFWLSKRVVLPSDWRSVSLLLIQAGSWLCTLVVCIILAATRTFVVSGEIGVISSWVFYALMALGSLVGIGFSNRSQIRWTKRDKS